MIQFHFNIQSAIALFMGIGFGCSPANVAHIYSPDKSQCLTVITEGFTQYLIAGEFYKVPDTNYVKLDISEKDLEVENSLNVCWGEGSWDVVISSTQIIESKLDTIKYSFETELPTTDGGIPTEAKFRAENCATISFILKRPSPPSKTTVIFR